MPPKRRTLPLSQPATPPATSANRRAARRHVRSAVALSALLALTAPAIAACGDDAPAHELVGFRPSGSQPVDVVAITDASAGDAPFEFRAAEGELLIAYFGYTFCPDVCPTSLAVLKKGLAQLGDDASRIDVAMATVDPDRDSGEVLTGYVQSFVPEAHALRTDDDDVLRAAADSFGVSYSVTTAADGDIEVAHSGAMYVVDDQGDLLLTWPFGVDSDAVTGDLEVLLRELDARPGSEA